MFRGAELLTTLSVSMQACRSAIFESLSARIVERNYVLTLRMQLNVRSGVAVDTGTVKIIVRIAVTLGYSSLFVRRRVSYRVDGFSEASCFHFDVHLTISPSKMTLTVKSLA